MRTNHDEKIIEHIMESRNTGLSDKIKKSAKNGQILEPRPLVNVEYNLKIVCACANDAAPEICALQQNVWYEINTY